ncbi:MAG TPA: GIY-YIG nuclease family protein, partial [Candidatus Methylacidiphilales bacterium]|nr:GIY-YIG nuclease family protein [Candidatus Methylacidiphilales bacterium]
MTPGYQKEYLLEKLIDFIREIKRFPVSRELRMKAYADRTFPSTKTFETHFGSKGQLVASVLKFCEKGSGFDDVIHVCKETQTRGQNEVKLEPQGEQSLGVVYLIKSGKYHKIGKTKSIGRRVYDLAIQLAEEPTTIHVIKTDDSDGIEAYWHKRFAAKRKGGEWFDLNASD